MSTYSRVAVPGGACGLEESPGENVVTNGAKDFVTGAEIPALKSRLDRSTEATAATAFTGRSERLMQCAQSSAGWLIELASASAAGMDMPIPSIIMS